MTLVSWLLVFGAMIILALAIDATRRFFTSSEYDELDIIDPVVFSSGQSDELDELPNGDKAQVVKPSPIQKYSDDDINEHLVADDIDIDISTLIVSRALEKEPAEEEIVELFLDVKSPTSTIEDESITDESIYAYAPPLEDELAQTSTPESASMQTLDVEPESAMATQYEYEVQLQNEVSVVTDQANHQDDDSVTATLVEETAEIETPNSHVNVTDDVVFCDEAGVSEVTEHIDIVCDVECNADSATNSNLHTTPVAENAANVDDGPNPKLSHSDESIFAAHELNRPIYEVIETPGIIQADLFSELPPNAVESMDADEFNDGNFGVSATSHQVAQVTSDDQTDTMTASIESVEQAHVENTKEPEHNILLDYIKSGVADSQQETQRALSVPQSLGAKFRQFVFSFPETDHHSVELPEAEDKTIVLDASLDPRQRDIDLNIALRLQLPSQGALGKNLAELLSYCQCNFDSEHRLFHRYEKEESEYMQFSVAVDNLDGNFAEEFENEHYASVVFFMVLPGANKSAEALDCMIETARYVAESLNGVLLDFRDSVLCEQTVIHFNKKIRDYERRRLIKLRSEAQK